MKYKILCYFSRFFYLYFTKSIYFSSWHFNTDIRTFSSFHFQNQTRYFSLNAFEGIYRLFLFAVTVHRLPKTIRLISMSVHISETKQRCKRRDKTERDYIITAFVERCWAKTWFENLNLILTVLKDYTGWLILLSTILNVWISIPTTF